MLCGLIGSALFFGDAIITPAISVLSAVEGLKLVTPLFEPYVAPITIVILLTLFSVQRHGTAMVAAWFGPITAVWFLAIAATGVAQIISNPRRAQRGQSRLCSAFPARQRLRRVPDAWCGVPGRDRRRSAVRRSRSFRPQTDPDGMGWPRTAIARAQLPGAGRTAAGRPEGDRKSLLQDGPRGRAVAHGRAGYCRDGDCKPGRHHWRVSRWRGRPCSSVSCHDSTCITPRIFIPVRSTCRRSTRCCSSAYWCWWSSSRRPATWPRLTGSRSRVP